MTRPFSLALLAGACLAALVPVAASAKPERRAAGELNDPYNQARAAAAAALLSQMLLDVKVGPLARAMENMGDEDARYIPNDARLGDLLSPDDRAIPGRMARAVPKAMGKAGAMAGAFEAMIPEIEIMSKRMQKAMDRASRGY